MNWMLPVLLLWLQPRPCHCLKMFLSENPIQHPYPCIPPPPLSLNLLVLQLPQGSRIPASSSNRLSRLAFPAAWNPQSISIMVSYGEHSTSWILLCICSTIHPSLFCTVETHNCPVTMAPLKAIFWHLLRLTVLHSRSFIFPGVFLSYFPLLFFSGLPSLLRCPHPFNHCR